MTPAYEKRCSWPPTRKIDPTLAARYHRLIVEDGKHHTSAACTLAATLLTRIAACLRNGTPYQLADTDGRSITEQQGRAIIIDRYTIPAKTRASRRQLNAPTRQPRRNERAPERSRQALRGTARFPASMNPSRLGCNT